MSNSVPPLSKDRDAILLKLGELIEKADRVRNQLDSSHDHSVRGDLLSELKASSINLLI